MHIVFNYITFKNLFSYGNVETKITLDDHRNTIVTGKNGTGKSSGVLDGLTYALYNKPYRKVNLGQLVNSINKKDLKVTVCFTIGQDTYKVVRGQKPNVFLISKNDVLIEEDSAKNDYQAYLENEILGINYKTFKQIVVIGKATYVPFMNLTPAERRSITEDVLDIAIFSSMLDITKQKVSACKSTIESLTYEIGLLKNQIESQKKLLETLEQEAETKEKEDAERRESCLAKIAELEESVSKINESLEDITDTTSRYETLKVNKEKLEKQIWKLENYIDENNNKIKFFEKDSCPTCSQSISEEFRDAKTLELTKSSEDYEKQCQAGKDLLDTFVEKIENFTAMIERFNKLNQQRINLEYSLKTERSNLESLNAQVKSESIDLCRTKLREYVTGLVDKVETKNTASKDIEYFKACVEILKDSGIKAKVISTFIPIMNKLINEYLERFDLFVSFELDEMFNETIKSRNRDTFTYNSFSEGEKMRIDTAILFSWRKIAMLRNSVSTNLLILDEIIDSSFDPDAIGAFLEILTSAEESLNTIIISHRENIPDIFDRYLKVYKKGDFSYIDEE